MVRKVDASEDIKQVLASGRLGVAAVVFFVMSAAGRVMESRYLVPSPLGRAGKRRSRGCTLYAVRVGFPPKGNTRRGRALLHPDVVRAWRDRETTWLRDRVTTALGSDPALDVHLRVVEGRPGPILAKLCRPGSTRVLGTGTDGDDRWRARQRRRVRSSVAGFCANRCHGELVVVPLPAMAYEASQLLRDLRTRPTAPDRPGRAR